MNNLNQNLGRKVVTRLILSAIIFIGLMILSAVTFYYFHAKAPLLPLLVAILGGLPATIAGISLHDLWLLRVKKT